MICALGAAVAALASPAGACVCPNTPLVERVADADAAVVGTLVAERETEVEGAPERVLTVHVVTRVKGEVGKTVEVRSPSGTDCDAVVPRKRAVGLVLTRGLGGVWLVTACSVVSPGLLVAEGGEPRGGPIKVAVGIAVLLLVLAWALRRLRKGARPRLPGAPGP